MFINKVTIYCWDNHHKFHHGKRFNGRLEILNITHLSVHLYKQGCRFSVIKTRINPLLSEEEVAHRTRSLDRITYIPPLDSPAAASIPLINLLASVTSSLENNGFAEPTCKGSKSTLCSVFEKPYAACIT